MFERYSFVAITTVELARARRFWSEQLGFRVLEEESSHFFMVDAGGLRLCIDKEDGDVHAAGGSDPVIGLKVGSLAETLSLLSDRGVHSEKGPVLGPRGSYAVIRDPDGRAVILTEAD